jgi:hypothetical protein
MLNAPTIDIEDYYHVSAFEALVPLVECPLSTVRFGSLIVPLAGGGYLRLFPYA